MRMLAGEGAATSLAKLWSPPALMGGIESPAAAVFSARISIGRVA
jgi:hypothetical protein